MKLIGSPSDTLPGSGVEVQVPVPCGKRPNLAVNAAFFQEIKTDNIRLKQLLLRLNKSLDRRPNARRRVSRLSAMLADLRDHLAMHFALEECYGYFNDAVQIMPELSSLAQALRGEHVTLYAEIANIAEQAEDLACQAATQRRMHRILARARAFVDQLSRHECRETEMILDALYVDLGVGD